MNNEIHFEQKYLDTIKSILNDGIHDYQILSGADGEATYGNVVFKINQEWIFSFLRKFHKISPIPVPEIYYEGKDFMGCRLFDGEPFTKVICDTLSTLFMGTSVILFSLVKKTVPISLIQTLNIIVGSLLILYGAVRFTKVLKNSA